MLDGSDRRSTRQADGDRGPCARALARRGSARVTRAAACADDPIILVSGEAGTGKTAAARALHERSPHAAGPFVVLSCARVALASLGSNDEQAGAIRTSEACLRDAVERSHGGTLVLVEIARLPRATQQQIVPLLEAVGRGCLVGPTRIVATTRSDLDALSAAGLVDERLAELLGARRIVLPPLRERSAAILPLARLLARRAAERYRRPRTCLAASALAVLASHRWPGNLRELESAIEYATMVAPGELIERCHLPDSIRSPGATAHATSLGARVVDRGGDEVVSIGRVRLPHGQGSARDARSRAASMLGMSCRMLVAAQPRPSRS